jgi:predicted N-acyltransferase
VHFPYKPSLFGRLQENLGKNGIVYAAFKNSRLIGFSLVLEGNGIGYGLELGVEDDLPKREATYFNLCYNKPIKDGIGGKTKTLYFGQGLPELKVRRGCKLRDVYVFYRSPSRIRNAILGPWFELHSWWVKRKHSLFSASQMTGQIKSGS